jgi:branched-subunit amino acid ABC-type transport system permease component
MKFTFAMLASVVLGLVLLEVGQQTAMHLISQAGFAAVVIGGVGTLADLFKPARQYKRT